MFDPWYFFLMALYAIPYWYLLWGAIKDWRLRGVLLFFPFLDLRTQVWAVVCGILIALRIAKLDIAAELRRKILEFRPRAR